MALTPGTRLGPYEIVAPLGAGGMGEVYRGHDPRLGREVAIKILPADVAREAERLARFDREARAIAALNHPHILTIFDVGTDDGVPYVVTELLDGETWRDVLVHRAPSPRQVLLLAAQAAQGLAAAHAKGFVHRDLKPENLFLTTDGRVKILDFGLAKQPRPEPDAPTVAQANATHANVVVGTLAYLAPEQVQAAPLDARADVFAFGVVLYELLTGQHPFRRETVAATLAAILQEPLPSLADRGIPAAAELVVRHCTAKRREDRYADGQALTRALAEALETPPEATLQELEERSPYPGLQAFTEQDAAVFFGREAEVQTLWPRIRTRRLLAVIAPSGAGKTSFLRAGVIPARPQGWGAIVCTPGTAPMRGLGRALLPVLAGDLDALQHLLSIDDPAVAFDLVHRWRRAHDAALLVVDQFEELFTLNGADTQAQIGALLGRLAREADVHVVLVIRDDFLIRCAEQAPLSPIFETLTPLTALTREALRRAVTEPARARGYCIEDEALVEEMAECVEGSRGALPLLAFAVARLWEARDRTRKLLTREAYDASGGVAGALAQHAEATMDRIGAEREGVVREIFRNLVTAQGTRAVMDREELLSVFADRAAAVEVLQQLVDARLLTAFEVEGHAGEVTHHVVEVVHESLLKAWPRLVRWQVQEEEGAVLRGQLKQAAHLWDEKGRTPDLLWTGAACQEYALWRARYAGALTALEEDFARAMSDRARRRKRLVRAAVAAVVLISTGVAIAIAVSRHRAMQQAQRAEREARLALASKLVALGRSDLQHYPSATLAYARKSLEVADNAEARRLAVDALWRSPSLRVLPMEREAGLMSFSLDGTRLARSAMSKKAGSPDTSAIDVLLYTDDGSPPTGIAGFGYSGAVFTPKGDALIAAEGNSVRMVSIPDGREIRRFEPQLPNGRRAATQFGLGRRPQGIPIVSRAGSAPDAIEHLRLEPYGDGPARWLGAWRRAAGRIFIDHALTRVALVRGRSVRLRPVAGDERTPEREVARLETAESGRLAFSPDFERLAVGDLKTGRLAVWRVDSPSSHPERILTRAKPAPFVSPVFDATGVRIAWASSAESAVSLWDLEGPPDAVARVLETPATNNQDILQVAFVPHLSWLAVAHADGVAFWAFAQPWPRILAALGGVGNKLRFTSDSRRLLSCDSGDGLSIWPLDSGAAPARTRLSAGECWGLSLTPDDRQVLWSGPNETHLARINGTGEDFVLTQASGEGGGTAIDASGRWGASVALYPWATKKIRIWDLVTGRSVREWAQVARGEPEDGLWGVWDVAFLADGRLIIGQVGGVRLLDPRTGASEWAWTLPPTELARVAASDDGRRAVAFRVPEVRAMNWIGAGEIVLLDLATGGRRSIASHATSLTALGLNADGSVLVSGALDGTVRVGSSDGREPHLLCCHAGRVEVVAVSPDGKWVASGGRGEIRLWPMPDLTKPPLHTLPYDALMAKLRALTNLEVVEDKAAPTGYKIAIGPFPGWKHVPTW